ncbi:hypothetical protein HDU77_005990 [Chytriomyces hyalinus]|nr:hypothetical protein HDU77_005990 [Chytriomyces hyalinus]
MDEESGMYAIPVPQRTTSIRTATPAKPNLRLKLDQTGSNTDSTKSGDGGAKASLSQNNNGGSEYTTDVFAASPPDSPSPREQREQGHSREASPRVLSPPPDEDWFLDYYASTPSTAPPVLRVPLPTSHSSSTSATSSSFSSSVPHPSMSSPLMHSNTVSSFPQGGALRRTNTASVLLGSKSKLSDKDVHIPTRQSSRNTAFPFGARGLTSSPVQVPAVLADTKSTSRNHENSSPPPTFRPSPTTESSAPINSNHRVQIESLLESGARALALLNINDALSLWKQAASGAAEGSLLSLRALSNLCVAYRRQGDVAKSYESALDAWKILERHLWIEANPVAAKSAPASIVSASGRSLLSHGTVHSLSNSSKEAGTLGANTDTVVNLLVGVGLIGFDEGFALGTDDSLTGRKGTIGKGISRKASVAPSILGHGSHQQQHQQQQQQQQALQQKQQQQEQERQREEEDSKIDDALIKCMRAVIKVTKTWLERRRRTETPEPAKQTASSFLHKQPSFAHSHSSKITRMASLDSFSSSSSAESSSSSSTGTPAVSQIPIDPVLLVSILNLATNTGNLYFTTHHYQLATILHEAALDLSQDILTTFPLPAKTAPSSTSTTSSIKLSYIHAHTLMTKNRSMSHLSLCLGASGDVHRAVRFGQMAQSGSTSVAGPQPADRAGSHARQWRFTRAGVAGNLARAQFAVGRYVEGMRGCVAAVDLYARTETFTDEKDEHKDQDKHKDKDKAASQADRAGLLRALANVGACWVEAGRLGCTVHVWVGDPTGAGLRRGAGPNGDSMPDFSFYDSHFAIPRPNVSVPSVSIPQRMHSSLRRDFVGTDVDLGILDQVPIAFARKNAPLWFADVLTGIRLLQRVISEAGKYKYLECIGVARFNIASACIIIQKPYLAAQMLTEAPYAWNDIMKQVSRATTNSNNTNTPNNSTPPPIKNIPALDPSHLFSNQIVGSKALFNFTQLLFIIGSNRLIRASTLAKPTESEAVALDKVSKLVLATVKDSGPTESSGASGDPIKQARTLNMYGDENEKGNVNLIDGVVDPALHVISLKLCLRLFDGSSQGPHSTPLSKIKSVEGLPLSPQKSFFSNDYHDAHSTDSSTMTNNSNTRQQPYLVLPETPKPAGSPTSYTTRICLALARSLLTMHAPSLDRRGESCVSQRQQARRWCSAEATAGVENAAIASGASSSSGNSSAQDKTMRDKETIGTGLAAKRGNELKRRSMVVKGSALEGLLVSALSGTGEVHGNLAMEVGSIALEVEMLESKNWVLDDLLEDKLANSSPVTAYQDGIVHRLVRLASRRVRDGVIGPMRFEEAALEEAIRPISVASPSLSRQYSQLSFDDRSNTAKRRTCSVCFSLFQHGSNCTATITHRSTSTHHQSTTPSQQRQRTIYQKLNKIANLAKSTKDSNSVVYHCHECNSKTVMKGVRKCDRDAVVGGSNRRRRKGPASVAKSVNVIETLVEKKVEKEVASESSKGVSANQRLAVAQKPVTERLPVKPEAPKPVVKNTKAVAKPQSKLSKLQSLVQKKKKVDEEKTSNSSGGFNLNDFLL